MKRLARRGARVLIGIGSAYYVAGNLVYTGCCTGW